MANEKLIISSLLLAVLSLDANAIGRRRSTPEAPSRQPLIPAEVSQQPSDDPADYFVDTSRKYSVELSDPKWVVPSNLLPARTSVLASNNNCAMIFHDNRLFLAWRTAPTHFASDQTQLNVISSADFGSTWQHEQTIKIGKDMREPGFISVRDQLYFKFFEGGTNPLAFEPQSIFVTERLSAGRWTEPVAQSKSDEVPWEIKKRFGRYWMTSYSGGHYDLTSGESNVNLHFKVSDDGLNWNHVNPSRPVVYTGGASEMAFEFTADQEAWGVTRNEDGDHTGFGSHLVSTTDPSDSPWIFPQKSNPHRYDSPKMFRHGKDLYLVARREVGDPYDQGLGFLPIQLRRLLFLGRYSSLPKRTALYRIDQNRRSIVHVLDLPSAGDTAFPALVRLNADTILVANYTSPLDMKEASWITGQISPRGTQIYLQSIHFIPN